jgi:hypothetical protein
MQNFSLRTERPTLRNYIYTNAIEIFKNINLGIKTLVSKTPDFRATAIIPE